MGWSAAAFGLVAPYWWLTLFLALDSPVSAVAHGAVQGLLYGAVTAGGVRRLMRTARDPGITKTEAPPAEVGHD